MTTLRNLRQVAAAALLLTVFAAPAASSAAPLQAPAHPSMRSADIIEPALPVEEFPGQVQEACGIWKELTWPQSSRPADYPVADTRLVIRGSNVYRNRSGDLPLEGRYREYDVNPRNRGEHRDAERVVRDQDTHTVWYTGDHYDNFQEIASGCE
ncbi:guanine-specific ribonuclease N1 and T1 [Streptomyces sp. CA-278952]|uniref:ribonuclease domain-containing protein n=1 Tax=unclassified Streptomyces TaxID=2593676 RepID=UPI002368565F|nr:ribonuclease domain-containing protein [Streptomyces sp. CA-278952]WDG27325.1 guanine-specific ribonuclease N1 and T1 [Streptomyces sp. CA-278952]